MEKKKVTIDRSQWIASSFADERGRSCVVGHILRSYGVTQQELEGRGTLLLDWTLEQAAKVPVHIMDLDPRGTPKLTDQALKLIGLNDCHWGRKFVEDKLIEAALEIGVELEFTGPVKEGP